MAPQVATMRAWQKTRTSSGRPHPVQRKDDPGVLLQTLKDAARFIGLMEPWRQARAYWHRCAGEILKAAKTGKRSDIVKATRSLEDALCKQNWL